MARFSLSSCVLAVALAFGSVSTAQASTIPYGVQNDVSNTTVASWGWVEHYVGAYGNQVAVNSLFSGINANDWVMIGGRNVGSGVVDVLAAARLSDILTTTGQDQTHAANGAEWYFNYSSMGFAGLGDQIHQTSADVIGSGHFGMDPNGIERDRLSWHGGGENGTVYGGWRSGSNVWLNSSQDWERVVWTAQATPEAHEWMLMAIALGSLAFVAVRRRQTAA